MRKTFIQKLKIVGSFAIVIAILVVPFFASKTKIASDFSHTITIGSKALSVAYADTEIKREQGLSGTQSLGDNQGMLFFFDTSVMPGFWMKDMNYPLDIIWINKDKKIVSVSENLDPKTYPQTFSPSEPIQYVLEVQSGFYKTNSLKVGDSLSF